MTFLRDLQKRSAFLKGFTDKQQKPYSMPKGKKLKGENIMVVHRNTNYIKFVSARHTTACNAGEVLEAWKDDCNNWHIWNPKEGKRYSAFVGTIRAIAGECLEQDRRVLPLEWRLAH